LNLSLMAKKIKEEIIINENIEIKIFLIKI